MSERLALPEEALALAIAGARGTSVKALGLRFDRVARRMAAALRADLDSALPGDATVLVTLTAPIRQANRTAAELRAAIVASLARTAARGRGDDVTLEVQGNRARLRRCAPARRRCKLLLLVHNADVDAERLLDDACAVAG